MKKIVALLLAGVMALVCVACGNGNTTNTENNTQQQVEIADANEILTKAWEEYKATAGEDLQFPIAGGNVESMITDMPAKFDLSIEYAEDALVSGYCIPVDTIAMTDDISTMMHMMMANNFTAAAYHVTDAANVETVVANIKDATVNNQWMCGFPETLIIVTVGEDYVVSVFGNAQLIEAFKTALTTVYGDVAVVAVEENLSE